MIPLLVAASVVVVTVLYFLIGGSAGEKKTKLPVTLQDPMVKYPLRLINKQVDFTQTPTCNKESALYSYRHVHIPT